VYAAIDIETDGLDPCVNNIFEVAVILADEFYNEQSCHHWFVKPQYTDYVRSRKFSDEEWEQILTGKSIEQVIDELHSIIPPDGILVGYNIKFDLRFLQYWGLCEYETLDVMELYHKYFDDPNKITLKKLGYMYGIKARSHRAEWDARKTLWILKKFNV